MPKSNIRLFEDSKIRTAWDDEKEEWYFSIVDVIAVLTESKNPSAYWHKLKQRLTEEGNQTVTNCHTLKLIAADGRRRSTDVANKVTITHPVKDIPIRLLKSIEKQSGLTFR